MKSQLGNVSTPYVPEDMKAPEEWKNKILPLKLSKPSLEH